MAKLNEQQRNTYHGGVALDDDNSSSATDPFAADTPPTDSRATSDSPPETTQVEQLKKQLELATERMAQMELEVTQSRLTRHTVEQAIGSPFPAAQDIAYSSFSGVPVLSSGLSRRNSPSQMNNQQAAFAMNGFAHGGLLPAPTFFNGQK
jgi:hypothetical protein